MKEETVADFLRGEISATSLADDLAGSEERSNATQRRILIEDMEEDFVVTRPMAISLCDSVLRHELEPDALRLIGFAVITSEKLKWDWDDEVLGEILHDWACPEINLPLSIENVRLFRSWLQGEDEYPKQREFSGPQGRLISETVRCKRERKA
jgi:hypothetical protein